MYSPKARFLAFLAPLFLAACGSGTSSDPSDSASSAADSTEAAMPVKPVTVYSSRAEQLIKPIFDVYTEQTGVPVEYLTDSEQPLIQSEQQCKYVLYDRWGAVLTDVRDGNASVACRL